MSFKNKIVTFQVYKKSDPTIQMTVRAQQVAENKSVISEITKSASFKTWQDGDEKARAKPFIVGNAIDDSIIDTYTASLVLFNATKDGVATTTGSTTISSFVKIEDVADDSIIAGASIVFEGAAPVLSAAITGKVDLVAAHRQGTLTVSKAGYNDYVIPRFVADAAYVTGSPFIIKLTATV